ncbi:protein kinase domain-containing protein, partial [Haematococcus lacustris]
AAINTLLTHENIVNTYAYDLRPVDSSLPDNKHAVHWKLYIIQEWCDSGNLAQAVDRGLLLKDGRPNYISILQLAKDIAKGLAFVQQKNVIHGDLSSGNIMLRFDARAVSCYTAKVCDFGLSRFLDGPNQSHISNARQGTPFYISPEVLHQGIMSKDADVFSYGVLLWEMWCGRPPWRNPELQATGIVL